MLIPGVVYYLKQNKQVFCVISIDILSFYGRISKICKDIAETKRKGVTSARGGRWEPLAKRLRKPLPASPGMTGTGSPVTEEPRYPACGVIRVVPRLTSPLFLGVGSLFFMEVESNES